VVERSPEKAGVGGSTPSLATIFSITYIVLLNYFGRLKSAESWVDRQSLQLDACGGSDV
jgi:hypothetical protein